MNTTAVFDNPGVRLSFLVIGCENMIVVLSMIGNENPARFWLYVNDSLVDETVIDTGDLYDEEVHSFHLLSNMNPMEYYLIALVKITEINYNYQFTESNYVVFHGIEMNDGSDLLALTTSNQKLKLKIEFIGDSIMAGYRNLCKESNAEVLMNDYGPYAIQSFAVAWPYLTAEILNAEQHTIGK